jgi:hypothetical protein
MDAIDRRNLHLAHRAQAIKARGGDVRSDLIMKQVADDLRLVDRAKAEGAIGQRKKRKSKFAPKYTAPVARPELHAEALARKTGSTFFSREVLDSTPRGRSSVERITGVDAERSMAMQRRLALLSERGPGRVKSEQSVEKGPWIYPALAREIIMTTLAYNASLGGYRGLNARDRRRRFFRALEDLCTRSNRLVGVGWWVPK